MYVYKRVAMDPGKTGTKSIGQSNEEGIKGDGNDYGEKKRLNYGLGLLIQECGNQSHLSMSMLALLCLCFVDSCLVPFI